MPPWITIHSRGIGDGAEPASGNRANLGARYPLRLASRRRVSHGGASRYIEYRVAHYARRSYSVHPTLYSGAQRVPHRCSRASLIAHPTCHLLACRWLEHTPVFCAAIGTPTIDAARVFAGPDARFRCVIPTKIAQSCGTGLLAIPVGDTTSSPSSATPYHGTMHGALCNARIGHSSPKGCNRSQAH